MNKYEELLKKLNGKMDEDDLRIGEELISVYGSALNGHELSIDLFKDNPKNIEETYTKYNKTCSDFWERLLELSESEKEIYLKAIIYYKRFMGID